MGVGWVKAGRGSSSIFHTCVCYKKFSLLKLYVAYTIQRCFVSSTGHVYTYTTVYNLIVPVWYRSKDDLLVLKENFNFQIESKL